MAPSLPATVWRAARIGTLGLFVAATPACMTSAVMDKMRPGEELNAKTKKTEKVPGQPGYGVLLPFTVAGDLATAPLWLPFMMLFAGKICG